MPLNLLVSARFLFSDFFFVRVILVCLMLSSVSASISKAVAAFVIVNKDDQLNTVLYLKSHRLLKLHCTYQPVPNFSGTGKLAFISKASYDTIKQ